jgi:hypothetical protein
VAFGLDISAQLLVVINLAVVKDRDAIVLVTYRLIAGSYVNNAQPVHRQADVFFDKEPVIVGTAMHGLPVHRAQNFAIRPATRIQIKNAANSSHDEQATSRADHNDSFVIGNKSVSPERTSAT